MNETWKPVRGYEGLYEVSDWGNVRSLNYRRTGMVKLLKQRTNQFGYQVIGLNYDGKQHFNQVHRLVAEAFIPNPYNKPEVDHINTNRTDNRVENLRWVTKKENGNNPLTLKHISDVVKGENHPLYGKNHSEESKKKMSFNRKGKCRGESHYLYGKHLSEEIKKKISKAKIGKPSHRKKKVIQYTLNGDFIKEWDSATEAERILNINHSQISAVCKGRHKSTGGYIWRYKEEVA